MKTVHERLIELQSIDELKRKATRASRKDIWTVEDIDYATRASRELVDWFWVNN